MLGRLSSPRSYGFQVTPTSRSVTEARRRIAERIRLWRTGMTSDQVEELLLLSSEVITNAVTHTGATCTVCVRWTGTKVRVEVADTDPQFPHVVSPAPMAESGRGLWLVAELATAWGKKRGPTGKVVWFEIAVVTSPTGAAPVAAVAQALGPCAKPARHDDPMRQPGHPMPGDGVTDTRLNRVREGGNRCESAVAHQEARRNARRIPPW
ncbi:ATP-binding protein [Streptomyces sp. NPDC002514]|uniref:ATP-binding protein n=1 Tax=Streptomyces sp. NPDC001270 TaxID=3364554 RepID=UPI0036788394